MEFFSNRNHLRSTAALGLAFAFVQCPQVALALEGGAIGAAEGDIGSLITLQTQRGKRSEVPLISLDARTGRIRYGKYAARGEEDATNAVPDFSRAGYRGGGVALPSRESVTIRRILMPQAGASDAARIQSAIDEVAAFPADERGLRGVVLLKRGRYTLEDTLRLAVSGVILRGDGRGANGTVLRSTVRGDKGRIIEVGEAESHVPAPDAAASRTEISERSVPVGAMRVAMHSTAGYSSGDQVVIVRHPNEYWLGHAGIDTQQYGWTPKSYVMYYERVVTSLGDGFINIDAPIVDAIDKKFGGGSVYRSNVKRLSEIGIEDLQLEGDPETGIENGTPNAGPYFGIRLGGVKDAWVRNVAIRYVSHGISTTHGAHFNTFEDVAYLDPRYGETQGAQRYAFSYEGNASFNLTQRSFAEGARHAFLTGAKVPGPNVFLDCIAIGSTNDSGPHHRWATGILYDNVRDTSMRAQNRRNSGPGHGWAGAQQMFWNSESEVFVLHSPPFAMNWAVGQKGRTTPGQFAREEVPGSMGPFDPDVMPRSLYLQQLRDRLGDGAVLNIATPDQARGRIWHEIEAEKLREGR
ncbi:hypothetical protein EDF77_2660 [Stenotrophomonas maltophilia]|uniref:hypothetical protein n=1 Tax=Stenotrophomonas chelatiphaga TaxID=517011 RepID=UPI000FBAD1F4|nr:hypothetical protein [Stenotrophomonas chelatiphaga]MCS4230395.1 hypothetical protein [Stenotrophomonas chelatiphaga]ROQ40325.1 hypothetical protein EDF77_2660 [Stenotrophomonas maltophilia]